MPEATPTRKPARKHSEGAAARTCPECGGLGKLRVLKADIDGVPPEVARLLEQQAYRKVSAEVYDEPPAGIPGTGRMLRRIAFLGGSLPEIKSLADIPKGSNGKVQGVEIFAAGTRKGVRYSPQDLDQIVANFKRFSTAKDAMVRVPSVASAVTAVPGHEEEAEQHLLERTDLPAMGWPVKVWCEDKPCPACRGKGAAPFSEFAPAFRRVVLRLSDIRPGKTAGTYHVFSEVTTVTREEMLAKLQEWGMDPALFGPEVPDATLAEIVRGVEASMAAPPAPPTEPAPEEGLMSDGLGGGLPAAPRVPSPPRTPSQQHPSQVVLKYSEIQAALKPLVEAVVADAQKTFRDKVTQLDKFAEDRLAAEKRATINARLDALVQQGKVLPAEIDGGLPDLLFTLDASKVRKFSEGGKEVSRTPLDHWFAMKEAGPVFAKFAERVKGSRGGKSATADEELEKVQRFSEDGSFSTALAAMNKTPETYVHEFTEMKKKKPTLTAVQYGVPKEYAA